MTKELRSLLMTLRSVLGGKTPYSDQESSPIPFELLKETLSAQLLQIEETDDFKNITKGEEKVVLYGQITDYLYDNSDFFDDSPAYDSDDGDLNIKELTSDELMSFIKSNSGEVLEYFVESSQSEADKHKQNQPYLKVEITKYEG